MGVRVGNHSLSGRAAVAASFIVVGSIALPSRAEAQDATLQPFKISGTVALGQTTATRRVVNGGFVNWGPNRVSVAPAGTNPGYTVTLDRIDDATGQLRSYTTDYVSYGYNSRSATWYPGVSLVAPAEGDVANVHFIRDDMARLEIAVTSAAAGDDIEILGIQAAAVNAAGATLTGVASKTASTANLAQTTGTSFASSGFLSSTSDGKETARLDLLLFPDTRWKVTVNVKFAGSNLQTLPAFFLEPSEVAPSSEKVVALIASPAGGSVNLSMLYRKEASDTEGPTVTFYD